MVPDPIAPQAADCGQPRSPWRVLLVGDAERDEFGPTWNWLRSRTTWQRVGTIREAVDLLEAGAIPQILVLAKSRPGQFSAAELDHVRRAAPLIRIVVVRGIWCEGETCSGPPLPGTWRLAWHQSAHRLEAEWFRYQQGRSPVWELALTAGEDDLAMRPPLQWSVRGAVLVEIVTSEPLLADGFRSACRSLGLSTLWRDPRDLSRGAGLADQRADVCLYIAAGRRDFSCVEMLSRREEQGPLIALLGFPRWRDYVAVRRAGAVAVVSLPTAADVLQTAIATTVPDHLKLWSQAEAA